jgi:hypothetical protein
MVLHLTLNVPYLYVKTKYDYDLKLKYESNKDNPDI